MGNFLFCLLSQAGQHTGWIREVRDGYAFQYVNYVECSPKGQRTENDTCKQAGIKNFPTWQFSDGIRVEGMLHLQALGEKTGCNLP